MKIAAILYADTANPLGLPGDYPAEVKHVPDDFVFQPPWRELSSEELAHLFVVYSNAVQEISKAKESVPSEVALWQFRAALKISGLYDTITACIAQMPAQQRTVIEEQINYGNTIQRTHPTISAMAATLGITEAQVDDVFRLANSLQ